MAVNTSEQFTPEIGSEFTILNGNAITGNFDTVSLAGNAAASYTVNTASDQVTLTAVAAETDLEVQSVNVPPTAEPGDEIDITYTVTNNGLSTSAEAGGTHYSWTSTAMAF